MRARCGRCQTEVEVSGPGRFNCPTCGSLNEVRGPAGDPMGAPGSPPPGAMPPGAMPPGAMPPEGGVPPPPPPPDPPSEKTHCPECDFSFIVGDISVAVCPMCGAEVAVADGP